MMSDSDNVMAESIAREVAAEMQRPLSFAGAVDAVTSRLSSAGINMKGASLVDSSGLSVLDRLTATTLDDVVGEAAGSDQPQLRPLVDLLPIAGGSGTLSDRFLDPDTSRGAAGWLRAKTGSLTATNALAGVVTDQGGRVLTFALISNGAGPDRTNRDRHPGGDATFVRVRVVSAATELTVGRAVDWGFAADGRLPAGPARPTGHRVHAQSGHRRTCGGVPRGRAAGTRGDRTAHRRRRSPTPVIVDRAEWIRAASESMRVMTGGADGPGHGGQSRRSHRHGWPARRPARCWRSCPRAFSASTTRSVSSGGRLLLVHPNVIAVERQLRVKPADFRLWVCLHEVTHRVQFTANPWLSQHMSRAWRR